MQIVRASGPGYGENDPKTNENDSSKENYMDDAISDSMRQYKKEG